MLDYLIEGATVFDGVAVEPRSRAVGIRGERIAWLGDGREAPTAAHRVDGSDLYLCPGFIDSHGSTGLGYTRAHAADHKLFQGVTTEVIGNCGSSSGPIGDGLLAEMERLAGDIGFDFGWRSLGSWLALVEDHGLPLNVGTHVGHNTLRRGLVAGARRLRARDLQALRAAVERAMRDGALGLSTGLVYEPGCFADTAEIAALAKIVARFGGVYATHLRDERRRLEDAVDEAIAVGRAARLPVLISHLKAAERPNWGKLPRVIERVEAARSAGLEITFEVYPYTAVSTRLRSYLPTEALERGVDGLAARLQSEPWRRRSAAHFRARGTDFGAMVMITDSLPGARGASVRELASRRGQEPAATVCDLLAADPEAWFVYHCLAEDDVDAAVLWPHSLVCSDSWSYPVNARRSIGDPHPRTYGAFTRFLARYALERELLPFGAAVRKITSLPAAFLRLADRGRIAEGYCADLVLLDPARLRERATFAEPRRLSEGVEHLWVNGQPTIERGRLTHRKPGRVLRNAHAD